MAELAGGDAPRTGISIQSADYDLSAECDALCAGRSDIGAVVSFEGRVRGEDGLIALELEHYPAMTEREIERHITAARERWPLTGVRVIHRIGRLEPGARIVLVITASAHRQAAFEAAAFLMDYLKTRAPFWKREERAGGLRWAAAKESDEDAAKRWT